MKHIAAAFVKAQQAFGPALKTSNNPHFKTKYADLSNVVEAVIDALNSNGIAMIQQTHEDTSGVTVETMFLHESGESILSGKLHVPAAKNDPQGYGSALTYARRYSLMAACGIAPEDDDGNAASRPAPKPAARPIFITIEQANTLATIAAEVEADLPALFDWISSKAGRAVNTFSDIHMSEFHAITKALTAKREPK